MTDSTTPELSDPTNKSTTPMSIDDQVLAAFLIRSELMPEATFCLLASYTASTTLAKRARSELPPTVKIGNRHYFRFQDILDWSEHRDGRGAVDDLLGRKRGRPSKTEGRAA
jgi:hypothetical protein